MFQFRRKKLFLRICIAFSSLYLFIWMTFNDMYELISFSYPLQNVKYIVKEIELTGKCNVSAINPHPKNVTFLISSSMLCSDSKQYKTLLVVVKSYVGHFHLRLAIRKTWGNTKKINLVFMVGYQPYTQLLLQQESNIYKDIVQGSFEDKYHNNIFKTLMAYRWTEDFCNEVKYILFVDDDYFVNMDYLLRNIDEGTFSDDKMYAYKLFWRKPARHPSKLYYLSKDQYANNYFPSYPAGGAILISIGLLKKFNIAFNYVKHVHIDDLYLGIVAKLMDISLVHDIRFSLFFVSINEMKDNFCSHGYGSRGQMINAWKEFTSIIKNNI